MSQNTNEQQNSGSEAEYQSNPYYNIVLLAIAWALTLTTSTLLTTIGPLSAVQLGASNSLSAFTIGVFLIGAAMSSVPSGWFFRKYGRLLGFSIGCLCQLIGSLLGSLAIATNSLPLLYMGCFSIGLGQGLGQFYRFSAIEVAPPHLKSKAITYVLSGGIFAAFLGPTCADNSIHLFGGDYQGSYILIAAIAVLNELTILFVKFAPPVKIEKTTGNNQKQNSFNAENSSLVGDKENNNSSNKQLTASNSNSNSNSNINSGNNKVVTDPPKLRSTVEIITQPLFIISCTVATLAHTIMVMLMSNVTLDMLDHDYSFSNTSLVMELHFFAMFAPGFLSGKLIERHGTFLVALVGGIIFMSSAVVLAIDSELWNYILGMILLGVAWNLSFSAGTVMLTSSYKPIEATEVQAINDFILFSVAGGGSLVSGVLFSDLGWLALIYFNCGLMVLYLLLFCVIWFFSFKITDESESRLERQERLSAASERLLSRDECEDLTDTYGLFKGQRSAPRGESFAETVQNFRETNSFATYNEAAADGTDELTPLRSISVA